LTRQNKELNMVADVDVAALKELILQHRKKLRDLKRICHLTDPQAPNASFDIDWLRELGVSFKPVKLVRK